MGMCAWLYNASWYQGMWQRARLALCKYVAAPVKFKVLGEQGQFPPSPSTCLLPPFPGEPRTSFSISLSGPQGQPGLILFLP